MPLNRFGIALSAFAAAFCPLNGSSASPSAANDLFSDQAANAPRRDCASAPSSSISAL